VVIGSDWVVGKLTVTEPLGVLKEGVFLYL